MVSTDRHGNENEKRQELIKAGVLIKKAIQILWK